MPGTIAGSVETEYTGRMQAKPDLDHLRECYRDRLSASLRSIVEALTARPEVERIILFGSHARARNDLLTDLDLAVVMESGESFLDRCAALRQELDVDVDLDLLVYTPQEWRLNADRPFFRAIQASGRVLYAKRGS